jgi:hypothetical protein
VQATFKCVRKQPTLKPCRGIVTRTFTRPSTRFCISSAGQALSFRFSAIARGTPGPPGTPPPHPHTHRHPPTHRPPLPAPPRPPPFPSPLPPCTHTHTHTHTHRCPTTLPADAAQGSTVAGVTVPGKQIIWWAGETPTSAYTANQYCCAKNTLGQATIAQTSSVYRFHIGNTLGH